MDNTFIPPGLTRQVNKQEYIIDRPDPQLRKQLAELFRDDVEKTLAYFPDAIDLSLWDDFINNE